LTSQLERESETGRQDAQGSGGHTPVVAAGQSTAAPNTRSSTGGGGLSARPKRVSVRPSPRPLPPPDPEEDEDVYATLKAEIRRRLNTGVLPQQIETEEPQPELPPTPEQVDPAFSSPPTGIHNTPSRRPRRSKALAERISSPLKPSRLRPGIVGKGGVGTTAARGIESARGGASAERPNPRGLPLSGSEGRKRKKRDALLEEIRRLEADLDVAAAENERIRQARISHGGKDIPAPANKDEVIEVLARHALSSQILKEREDPRPAWLEAALNPISFMPFGSSASLPDFFGPPRDEDQDELAPPVSHHPLAMSAEEELPYLQAFTSLQFNSRIDVLPRESPDAPLLQQHSIAISSASPGLFAARVEMVVNTATHRITSLSVPRLDPAARAELAPFIAKLTHSDSNKMSGALRYNMNVLGWAMGEWLRVATRRARFWHALAREFGDEKSLVESVGKARSRAKRRGKRKAAVRNEDEEDDAERGGEDGVLGGKVTTADMLLHMGRTAFDTDVPCLLHGPSAEKSSLRVQWRIGFDWTGEAQSKIGVLVGVNGKCKLSPAFVSTVGAATWWTSLLTQSFAGRNADQRGSLAGVPALFDRLVRGDEEPLGAVRIVAALLAGEPGA
jgi:hypothetical protein